MTVLRQRITWGNFPGAPGYSNFFSRELIGTTQANALHVFFDAIKGFMPTGLQWTFPTTGDKIDESTGKITGSTSLPVLAPVTATGTGTYSGAAGAVVNWTSDTFTNGHRRRGRTFLVPIIASQFDTNGSLATACQSALQAAAGVLWNTTKPDFIIFRYPRPGLGASYATVDGYNVPDLTAVLRSRRI